MKSNNYNCQSQKDKKQTFMSSIQTQINSPGKKKTLNFQPSQGALSKNIFQGIDDDAFDYLNSIDEKRSTNKNQEEKQQKSKNQNENVLAKEVSQKNVEVFNPQTYTNKRICVLNLSDSDEEIEDVDIDRNASRNQKENKDETIQKKKEETQNESESIQNFQTKYQNKIKIHMFQDIDTDNINIEELQSNKNNENKTLDLEQTTQQLNNHIHQDVTDRTEPQTSTIIKSIPNNINQIINNQLSSQQNPQRQTVQTQIKPLNMNNYLPFILRRDSSWLNKIWPQFNMHHLSNNQYFMSAKMTSNNKSNTFLVAQSKKDFVQNGSLYLGKVKGNFVGNLVNIFGPGYNHTDYNQKDVPIRYLLATVEYQTNFFGTTKPRNFRAYVLKPGLTYYENLIGPVKGEQEIPLNQLYKMPQNKDKIMVLVSRQAQWSDKVHGYILHFGGRIKKPSIKNFILEDADNPQNTMFLFGKISENQFRLDIGHPLSPLVGLGIALSSFGGKIGCQ